MLLAIGFSIKENRIVLKAWGGNEMGGCLLKWMRDKDVDAFGDCLWSFFQSLKSFFKNWSSLIQGLRLHPFFPEKNLSLSTSV